MLHTSPLAAAAGKRDIQEKEDEEEEYEEEEKRTCEMWQLKLSSGGGTYGIHFCVVFDDDWSFKPKNIVVVVVVVVSCCEGKNNTHAVPTKKKLTRRSILPPQLHLASDDLTEWAPLTSRLFFGADSPLALDLERSEAKLFKEDFLSVGKETTPISSVNANF